MNALEVMDAAAREMAIYCHICERMNEARAAMAELIEAAQQFQHETSDGTQPCGRLFADNLRAALAKVTA